MTTTGIIDALAIATATGLAACAAVGASPLPESFPTEQVAIGADLVAGMGAGRHALLHRLHRRRQARKTQTIGRLR